MEQDWLTIAFRGAVYADLTALFGVAAYASWRPTSVGAVGKFKRRVLVLAIVGLLVSIAGFQQMVAAMVGVTVLEVDAATLTTVLLHTDPGRAALVRVVALALVTLVLSSRHPAFRPRLLTVFAAIALGSMAWWGHGAMDDGPSGWVHLIGDIIHLFAAGAWIGALVVLVAMACSKNPDRNHIDETQRALADFSVTGSVIVGTIVATGLVNSWILIGPAGLPLVPATLYGRILLVKLALFAAMLGLASINRYVLVPKLRSQLDRGLVKGAMRGLRQSLIVEISLALSILGLVAWMGTLPPIREI